MVMCLHASAYTAQNVCGGQESTSVVSSFFSLVLHMFSCLLHHQANWPMTFQEVCLHFPSHLRSVGVTYVCYYTQLCIGSGKLSSDPQACVTRTLHMSLPPSLYSQPSFQHLSLEFTESALQAKSLYIGSWHTPADISLVHGEHKASPIPGPEAPLLLFITQGK